MQIESLLFYSFSRPITIKDIIIHHLYWILVQDPVVWSPYHLECGWFRTRSCFILSSWEGVHGLQPMGISLMINITIPRYYSNQSSGPQQTIKSHFSTDPLSMYK